MKVNRGRPHARRRAVVSAALTALTFGALSQGSTRPAERAKTTTYATERPSGVEAAPAREAVPTVALGQPVPSDRTVEGTYPLHLASGAFPGHRWPDALVYVPAGIDKRAPLRVAVFFHGWNGCAASVSADVPTPCHEGGTRRGALGLISSVRRSGTPTVLIVPQLRMEARSSASGQLGREGGLRALVSEVLEQMTPQLGTHTVDDLGHVTLAAHSGGYVTALAALQRGGVAVDTVALFDAFYTGGGEFFAWITDHQEDFRATAERPKRFVSAFRTDGGTAGASLSLWRSLRKPFRAAGQEGELYLRSARTAVLTTEEAAHGVVLGRVPGDHQQAARWNFHTVLAGGYRTGE